MCWKHRIDEFFKSKTPPRQAAARLQMEHRGKVRAKFSPIKPADWEWLENDKHRLRARFSEGDASHGSLPPITHWLRMPGFIVGNPIKDLLSFIAASEFHQRRRATGNRELFGREKVPTRAAKTVKRVVDGVRICAAVDNRHHETLVANLVKPLEDLRFAEDRRFLERERHFAARKSEAGDGQRAHAILRAGKRKSVQRERQQRGKDEQKNRELLFHAAHFVSSTRNVQHAHADAATAATMRTNATRPVPKLLVSHPNTGIHAAAVASQTASRLFE